MRRLASIVALMLLFSGAAPVLACMAIGAANHEESSCCRAMHNHCGDMAKMGCCRTEIPTDVQPQLAAAAPSLHLHWLVVNWLAPTSFVPQTFASVSREFPSGHSPPGLLTANTIVLRI
jgi:hypothetical protein